VADLTALVVGSVEDPCRVVPYFWKPRDHVEDHSNRDFGSGSHRYREWAEAGHLLLSPGKTIDPEVIATFIAGLTQRFKVKGLAYDRWGMEALLKEFDRIGLQAYKDNEKGGDGLRLVPWGQGYVDMAPAVNALEFAVLERKLIHPGNPVLNWNMANAVVRLDPASNRKLDKEKARFRIDGAVALTMLLGLRARDRTTQKPIDIEALIA